MNDGFHSLKKKKFGGVCVCREEREGCVHTCSRLLQQQGSESVYIGCGGDSELKEGESERESYFLRRGGNQLVKVRERGSG